MTLKMKTTSKMKKKLILLTVPSPSLHNLSCACLSRLHGPQQGSVGQDLCVSCCLSVCLVTSNCYLVDEVIELNELNEATLGTKKKRQPQKGRGPKK